MPQAASTLSVLPRPMPVEDNLSASARRLLLPKPSPAATDHRSPMGFDSTRCEGQRQPNDIWRRQIQFWNRSKSAPIASAAETIDSRRSTASASRLPASRRPPACRRPTSEAHFAEINYNLLCLGITERLSQLPTLPLQAVGDNNVSAGIAIFKEMA